MWYYSLHKSKIRLVVSVHKHNHFIKRFISKIPHDGMLKPIELLKMVSGNELLFKSTISSARVSTLSLPGKSSSVKVLTPSF